MDKMTIYRCPYCNSCDEYYPPDRSGLVQCTECLRLFEVAGELKENRVLQEGVKPDYSKFKPFTGMPERTEEENKAYHDEMITEGLRRMQVRFEDPELPLKCDMTASIEYLQSFNQLCINTTSLSWVLGIIEFIGDVYDKAEDIRQAHEKYQTVTRLRNLIDMLTQKKQDNYKIYSQLKENCAILEKQLAKPIEGQ